MDPSSRSASTQIDGVTLMNPVTGPSRPGGLAARFKQQLHALVDETDGFLEETLRSLLESKGGPIDEIPGLLDGPGRIALARELIAAGVLQLQ